MYSYKPYNVIGKFNFPNSVCYDHENQYVIVSDTHNHHIQLLNSKTLTFHSIFGSIGTKYGQFFYPKGICIQPFTHYSLVCDSENDRIQLYNTIDGGYSFLYQIGYRSEYSQFNYPTSICCDEKGHIFVADTHNHRIQEFNESGRFLHLFGSFGYLSDQFYHPLDICFDKEHRELLVADCFNKKIGLWSHDSSSKPQCISQIPLNEYCNSVCVNPIRNYQILIGTDRNVFVYDSRNHKEPIQTLGSNTTGSGLGEFNCVSSLCVNEIDGTLLVVDKLNHRIQLFK